MKYQAQTAVDVHGHIRGLNGLQKASEHGRRKRGCSEAEKSLVTF